MKKEGNKEKDILQSNDLIRAMPFKDNDFRINLTQKRILYYFIDEILTKDYIHRNGDNWIRLKTNDLISAINTEKGGNSTLTSLQELEKFQEGRYKLRLNYHDEEGREIVRHTQWILEIETVVASGEIDVHFPNLIIENIKNLKGFYTSIPMKAVLEAKSSNQIKLYELLLSFASMKEAKFTPSELKKRLEIASSAYKKFLQFKAKVLDVCCNYINGQGLIKVTYEVERDARRSPTLIVFSIEDLRKTKNKNTKKSNKTDLNKSKIDKLISTNSTYWEEYQFNYRDLDPYAGGVRKRNGDEIRYSNPDFIKIIEAFLKDDEDEVMDNIKNQIDFEANLAERRGEAPLDRREAPYKIIRGLGGTSEKRSNYGMRDEDDKV